MKAVFLLLAMNISVHAVDWSRLAPLPNARGVAGAFAGVSHGVLIVAGGANFPDRPPWEGGTKTWHDAVYVLETPGGEWKKAGTLPRPLAYGVSVTHGDRVICVGGSDATRHYADCFQMEWKANRLVVTPLMALPKPLANASGVMVGDTLYTAGGLESPDAKRALKTVLAINLSEEKPAWKALDDLPGDGRMLSVAAGFEGGFYVIGGTAVVDGQDGKPLRRYLKEAYRHRSGEGWKRLADLPESIVAAPSPALPTAAGFTILGGDDGTQVSAKPTEHRGFCKTTLIYNVKSGAWTKGEALPFAHVTAPCVIWKNRVVIPSGEVRPGVRSPEVWSREWTP